ncbi:RNA polymerase III subunit C82 [Tilletia horrida]|nr:RNA polymerase III subunit C82 [Tilletia horrida]
MGSRFLLDLIVLEQLILNHARRTQQQQLDKERPLTALTVTGRLQLLPGMASAGETHHSQQKIKLCEQIVRDHFGSTAATITTILLARGRLAFPQIVKFLNSAAAADGTASAGGAAVPRGGPLGIGGSNSGGGGRGDAAASRIHPSTVEHCIMVLIQNNCAWHVLVSSETGNAIFGPALDKFNNDIEATAAREGRAAAQAKRAGYQEFFEMNPDEIIPRLRFGAYIGMAHDRFGSDAAQIIRLILKHGKLTALDICDQLAGEDSLKRAMIGRLLLLLLHRTYIRPSLASSHISPRDKFIAYETEGKLNKRGSVFTPKELRELKDSVAVRIEDEERMAWEGGASLAMTSDGGASKGKAAGLHASTGRLGIVASISQTAFTTEIQCADASSSTSQRVASTSTSKSGALHSSSSRSSKKRKLDATRSAASSANGVKAEAGREKAGDTRWDDDMDEDAMLARRGKLDVMNLTHPALQGCEVDMNIYLRVNYDRFDVHVRDDVVYQAVRAQYNTVTADVFKLFAMAGEYGDTGKPGVGSGNAGDAEMSSVRMTSKDERSAPISLNALSINLPDAINLSHGFYKKAFGSSSSSSSSSSKKKDSSSGGPSRAELLAEYAAVLSCAEDISSAARKRRFLAPAYGGGSTSTGPGADAGAGKGKGKAKTTNGDAGAGSKGGSGSLATRGSKSGGGGTTVSAGGTRVSNVYVVEYAEICARLKRSILKDVVGEKFGAAAVRVIGVLLEKGKLEEKYISKLGLLSLSHTRHICARLFESSLLGLQEVPKSNDRQPGRTFFLWYVDLPSAYAWLLEGMYQTLARLGERRGEELRRERALLNKVERTDVAASMTALLNESEKGAWEALQESLRRVAVAEQRVTSEAFVLANLPGE